MFTTYLLMFCRATIALLFYYSFGSKVLALRDFVVTVADFRLLPRRWIKVAAYFFLAGEVITAVALTIGGVLLPIGFLLAIVLLAIFSTALILALKRNITMSCNCFGRTDRPISRYDVVRNALLILVSLSGLWLVQYTQHDLAAGEIILLAFMGIALLLFVTNLSDVIATLLRPFPVYEERR